MAWVIINGQRFLEEDVEGYTTEQVEQLTAPGAVAHIQPGEIVPAPAEPELTPEEPDRRIAERYRPALAQAEAVMRGDG